MKTAKLTLKLKTDSGMSSTEEIRIDNNQYGKICKILHSEQTVTFTAHELEKHLKNFLMKNTQLVSDSEEDYYLSFTDNRFDQTSEKEVDYRSSQIMEYLFEQQDTWH